MGGFDSKDAMGGFDPKAPREALGRNMRLRGTGLREKGNIKISKYLNIH